MFTTKQLRVQKTLGDKGSMKFYIVTPSYNSVDLLKLCMASVADQCRTDVLVHHHIQDGGSTDGTPEYLAQYMDMAARNECADGSYLFSYVSEPDAGMYSAINAGWARADEEVDIMAWLNCDEQYLPNTLSYVAQQFEKDPTMDCCFGNLLILDGDGEFICYRKSYKPYWPLIAAGHLYTFSCTMFLRKKIHDAGFHLNEEYKAVADEDFVVRILQAGYKAKHLKRYSSVFAYTGNNLSLDPVARDEDQLLLDRSPQWIKAMKWILNKWRLFLKLLHGCYFEASSLEYSIYSNASSEYRVKFRTEKPTWKYNPGNR
ncbi:glycosyltransferase [Pontiellaceae bacterium B1224]|nr:glycosyltransferase [Pontiellaceae bacterium B1224]